MLPLDNYIKKQLDEHLKKLEELLDADLISITSAILPPLDVHVRNVIEMKTAKKTCLAIILETDGGIVEVVERLVETIRHHYTKVIFLVPNRAMSAGTIFVMSGDRILMNYFSCLGPIDPQIVKEDEKGRPQLVPALSYLNQFDRLNDEARKGNLTTAEYALLTKMDLGELYEFEQARALSIELIEKWLAKYKFKNWNHTETRKENVTPDMKSQRAKKIAESLSAHDKWHSHGRGLNMRTLIDEIGLKIQDFSTITGLEPVIQEYTGLLRDYMGRQQLLNFIHSKEYF